MSIGIQCGERIQVREELWQVESISTTGKIVTMSKVEPEVPEELKNLMWSLRDSSPGDMAAHNLQIILAYQRGLKAAKE